MQQSIVLRVVGIVAAIAVGVGLVWAIIINLPNKSTDSQSPTATSTPQPQTTTEPSQPGQLTKSVSIKDRAYSPAQITVKKGTKVVWTNKDRIEHNVVSENNAPAGGPPKSAPLLGKDQVFEFTYDTLGTFPYYCAPHPDMKGTVVVVE